MDAELARKFPEMKPVKGSPLLFTLNGFGLSMYGQRNSDPETGTYVATRFITLLFVPVWAIGSYRVADAENGGWYFLGKEGISKLWQTLNTAVLSIMIYAVGMMFWTIHTGSPDYRQRQALEIVGKHERGLVLAPLNGLLKVDGIGGELDDEVSEKIVELVLEGVAEGSWEEAIGVVQLVSGRLFSFGAIPGFYDDFSKTGEERLSRAPQADLEFEYRFASQMVRTMAPAGHVSLERFKKYDRSLLEALAVDAEMNIRYAVRLAEYCEADGDIKRCKELLQARVDELKGTEGARILGQILVSDGDYDAAYPLLASYVIPKLEQLKHLSDDFDKVSELSYSKAIDYLNDGHASESFYQRYENATEEVKNEMVNEMVVQRMNMDASYTSSLKAVQNAGEVVPEAMDFGIMQLRRAQSVSDGGEKAQLLESAEKTFLALQTVAGDSEDYQLSLGQVYFWMGRLDEGEKLFETARKGSGESLGVLYRQASIYHEIGDSSKGVELLKKAYSKIKDKEDGYSIASLLATMCGDIEEEVDWLKKCDQEQISVKIGLSNAEGKLAYQNGEYEKAIKFFKSADRDYKQLPNSAANFNNHALVMEQLYSLTGEPGYYRKSVDLMSEAVKLMPNNSILLGNAASQAFTAATIDLMSQKFSAAFTKEMSYTDYLRMLYNTDNERAKMRADFVTNESGKRAFKYLGALSVLAPKSDWVHSTGSDWYWSMGMDKEVLAGYKQMKASDWAVDEDWKKNQESLLSGKEDGEYLEALVQREKYDDRVRKKITDNDEWLLYQSSRIPHKLRADFYGGVVDYQGLVKLAKQAREKYPCSYTRGNQREAFLARGLYELSKSQAKVAKLRESHGRLLSNSSMLMTLTHSNDQALKKAVITHPDIKVYLKARHEGAVLFPESVTRADRYFVSLLDDVTELSAPADSEAYQTLYDESAKALLHRYPYSVSSVMSSYWVFKLSGQEGRAKAIYDDSLGKGLALPPLN